MHSLDKLNQSQRDAVNWKSGPLLLLAGPGSGKTTVIVSRIFYLLSKGVPPESILVITFTKEAAVSMRKRFVEQADREYPVTFATFHSFFYQILKQSIHNKSFQIITHKQKIYLLKNVLYKLNIHKQIDISDDDQLLDDCLVAIGIYKNTREKERSISCMPEALKKYFTQIAAEMRESMQINHYIDFDDMLSETYEILKSDDSLRNYWKQRFPYICIDEFQDINPVQYMILRLLTERESSVFAVGDDDQSIYGFRGSDPSLLQRFAKDYEAEIMYLNENYRSVPPIVEISAKVISENKNRFQKALHSMKKSHNTKPVSFHSFADRKKQYQFLLEELKTFSIDKRDCAVLFRTNTYMQGLAVKLTAEGIPFRIREGEKSIYEHFATKDIFAYLKIAEGSGSRKDMIRIMNKPVRFIHRESVDETGNPERMKAFYINTQEKFKSGNTQIQLIDKLILQIRQMKKMSLVLRIKYIMKAVQYEMYLKTKAAGDMEKLEEWLDVIGVLEQIAVKYMSVFEWLEAIESEKEMRKIHKTDEQDGSSVVLMTMHASKGLEFDHVIIPDCNDKMYPHGGLVNADNLEEERRLFYVGITRAKKSIDFLYLTGDKVRPKYPSKFIEPFLKK